MILNSAYKILDFGGSTEQNKTIQQAAPSAQFGMGKTCAKLLLQLGMLL